MNELLLLAAGIGGGIAGSALFVGGYVLYDWLRARRPGKTVKVRLVADVSGFVEGMHRARGRTT